jgi:hypothetical protein
MGIMGIAGLTMQYRAGNSERLLQASMCLKPRRRDVLEYWRA